jgi:hypothetical protein
MSDRYRSVAVVERAHNESAWAIGRVTRPGWFHIRRVVWGGLLARAERREGETLRRVTVLINKIAR